MTDIVKQEAGAAVVLPDGFDDFFGSVATETTLTLLPSSVSAMVPYIHVGKEQVFIAPDIIGDVAGITNKKITGIILYPRVTRQYWQRDENGDAVTDDNGDVLPPVCQSVDGLTGWGDFTQNQETPCVTCPAAQWGKDAAGNTVRPECSERRGLAILPDGSNTAVLVDCAPTSTRSVDMAAAVMVSKQNKGEGYGKQRVELTLKKNEKGAYGWYELVVDFAGVEPDQSRWLTAYNASVSLKEFLTQVDSSRQTIGEVCE